MRVLASWFPCAVSVGAVSMPEVRVVVGDEIHVFDRKAEQGQIRGVVDWARTGEAPKNKWAVRNGWSVYLDDGREMVITGLSSCGCGNELKSWFGPSWASEITVRS